MKTIKPFAFYGTKLSSVVIPEGVESIGGSTFSWCTSLTSVTLNEGLVKILSNPFYSSPITEITSNSKRFIVSSNKMELVDTETETLVTFLCAKLNQNGTYIISNDIMNIGSNAFTNCSNLTSVTLRDGLKNIGDSAFGGSGLKSVEIPTTVEMIDYTAFGHCKSLSKFSIKDGMKGKLGNRVLFESSLKEITLPKSLWSNDDTLIDPSAFLDSNLEKVIFDCDNKNSRCISGVEYYKGKEVTRVCSQCPA